MRDQHPQAGQTVTLKPRTYLLDPHPPRLVGAGGARFRVEDWGVRVFGEIDPVTNPATLAYMMRRGQVDLPDDDEVVYGKTDDGIGHLVHVRQIAWDGADGGEV
ncbi:hypothetical protein [Streptomonospora litoralis]|uniref:Uncharacterized protein n=1 Tax=Streptomonospora litoralis TaxID=2498135 RepID=A0A4P6Q084_9ACTN|nr:hypothetical protein [Streptomonospora litoralis]QBI53470.1 hypothetical protein EKD16_08380 [Streptomonospora litoralis]